VAPLILRGIYGSVNTWNHLAPILVETNNKYYHLEGRNLGFFRCDYSTSHDEDVTCVLEDIDYIDIRANGFTAVAQLIFTRSNRHPFQVGSTGVDGIQLRVSSMSDTSMVTHVFTYIIIVYVCCAN
jgi:hypothetical protein